MRSLQCLEAQFYSCAVYGQPLSDDLTGSGPQPIGCQQANFTNDDIYSLAMDVASNEIAHVNYLRTALGNNSVQCPLVNIGDAFSAAADAALGTTLSPAFSPYVNDLYFLTGAFIFEDLGVTAYKGALSSFQSSDIMTAAAGETLLLQLPVIPSADTYVKSRASNLLLMRLHACVHPLAHAYHMATPVALSAACVFAWGCELQLSVVLTALGRCRYHGC